MARLTVIIPVLNGMPYARETLASLETQIFRDFEVILWDNGSTDDTVEEARKWIPSRLPGRVVAGQPLPLHLCLARMVEESSSEFCAVMHADDICLPRRFEEEMDFLQARPDVALVGCQIEFIDPQGRKMPKETWAQNPVGHEDIVTQLLYNCPFCHPSIMFRTRTVLRCGNYAIPGPVEDLDLFLRLAQTEIVANLPSIGLLYRIHPKSISAVAHRENRLEDLVTGTVARHVEVLFGIKPATYLKLRHKAHPLSVVPLFKSAYYRSGGDFMTFVRMVRTPTFLYFARCLTRKRDYVSKLVFKSIEWLTRLTPSLNGNQTESTSLRP